MITSPSYESISPHASYDPFQISPILSSEEEPAYKSTAPTLPQPPSAIIFDESTLNAFSIETVVMNVTKASIRGIEYNSVDIAPEKRLGSCCPVCKANRFDESLALFVSSGLRERSRCIDTEYGTALVNAAISQDHSLFPKLLMASETSIYTSLFQTLAYLISAFRIRSSEITQGLILFHRLWQKHWECNTFALIRGMMKTAFLVCILIAHKTTTDQTIQNVTFSHACGVPPETLGSMELLILRLLNWDVLIHDKEFTSTLSEIAPKHFPNK
jgi:hypothetical protein